LYPVPILSGRTRAGYAANIREHLNTIVHTFPQLQDRRGEAASLDCARALALLAVKPSLAFDTYHVSAGSEAPTIGQIISAMDEATGTSGSRYSMCRVRDFGKIAREVVGRDRCSSGRLIEHALRLYAGFAELDYAFDNRRLRDEIGFEPLPFTDYVSECVRTSRGVGIAEQMRWDFK
jgi:nucleoside-diphosphate-sugar epimerase